MPGAIRWFTEYQPFTPAIQTLRGLLLGAPTGDNAIIAIAWSIGITLAGYLWARKLFSRDPSRSLSRPKSAGMALTASRM